MGQGGIAASDSIAVWFARYYRSCFRRVFFIFESRKAREGVAKWLRTFGSDERKQWRALSRSRLAGLLLLAIRSPSRLMANRSRSRRPRPRLLAWSGRQEEVADQIDVTSYAAWLCQNQVRPGRAADGLVLGTDMKKCDDSCKVCKAFDDVIQNLNRMMKAIDDLVDLQDKLRTFFEPLLKIGETNGETNIWKQNREQSDRQSCESITGSSGNTTGNTNSGNNTNTSGTESVESIRADARAISKT